MSDLATVDVMSTTATVADDRSPADRATFAAASHVRAPRVAAVGVIFRGPRTITTVRTPDGITGTVTAVAR